MHNTEGGAKKLKNNKTKKRVAQFNCVDVSNCMFLSPTKQIYTKMSRLNSNARNVNKSPGVRLNQILSLEQQTCDPILNVNWDELTITAVHICREQLSL